MGSNQKVAVLGAGIVGLSTALELQARFPSCDVTIIADKFFTDTTSDGAAGVFEPSPKFMGPDLETTGEWIRHSYEHYSSLLGEPCGVKQISGYALSNNDEKCVENQYLKHLLPVYRRLGEEELAEVSPGDWKYGTFMSTLSIPSRIYLPWAVNKFKAAGGRVLEKRVSNFSELASEFNLVFNCTGLGASELCNDPYVIPIRGQVIRIKNSLINHFYSMHEKGSFIAPSADGQVILGGAHDFGTKDLSPDAFTRRAILARTAAVRPEISTSTVDSEWIGLWAYRGFVRVEREDSLRLSMPQIIHNYGHGGYGVTSAPGTAHAAVDIFEKMHKSSVTG